MMLSIISSRYSLLANCIDKALRSSSWCCATNSGQHIFWLTRE